jgi:hypothetical protein
MEIRSRFELLQNESFEGRRDRSREEAIEGLRRLRRPLPAGFTFDRNAAK